MDNDNKRMTLEERKAKALELRRQGYNCAQTVIMVFPDVTGLDEATAARIASGLGSGVGATGEICGVANAMAICEGMRHGSEASEKAAAAKAAGCLCRDFAAANGNRIACRDLKGKEGVRPCNELILQGIEIFHNSLK